MEKSSKKSKQKATKLFAVGVSAALLISSPSQNLARNDSLKGIARVSSYESIKANAKSYEENALPATIRNDDADKEWKTLCEKCAVNPLKILRIAENAGFTRGEAIVATAIAISESDLDTNKKNINANGSIDRGLWQINNRFWSNISNKCAFDPSCNAGAAYDIYKKHGGWRNWTMWRNNAYKKYESIVKKIVKK